MWFGLLPVLGKEAWLRNWEGDLDSTNLGRGAGDSHFFPEALMWAGWECKGAGTWEEAREEEQGPSFSLCAPGRQQFLIPTTRASVL